MNNATKSHHVRVTDAATGAVKEFDMELTAEQLAELEALGAELVDPEDVREVAAHRKRS